ncbi:MAG: homocysteine S-methyltransferase family protein [Candidatus Poribacteria bacterium]|nr:homocysteine S-methyltransferase family protein [Candidatus Poribacteria bacterium]
MKTFLERLAEPTPLIFDGGFGSELFARGINLANSAVANELHPDAVIEIHASYIEAGSDVIETNTFVASRLHLEMAGKDESEAEKIARAAVELAKAAVEKSGKEVYIAGSIGPSPGAIEADSGDVDFGIPNPVARDAHERLVNALAEGGVDFFCIETMFSAKEAAMAVDVARKTGLPIAVNSTYKYTRDRKTGKTVYKTDWGHSPVDLLEILSSGELSNGDNLLDDVQILGLNCGAESRRSEHTGMPYAINGIQQLREAMDEKGIEKRMMAYPNAGIPRLDENLRTYYTQTPEEMVRYLPDLLKAGAYFIGGCCGTSPSYIRAFREALSQS